MGGTDSSLYTGDINYHKVVSSSFWMVRADNILLGGKDIGLCGKGGCRVIADTGTSVITAPTNSLQILIGKIFIIIMNYIIINFKNNRIDFL